jgi:hypothetical protein
MVALPVDTSTHDSWSQVGPNFYAENGILLCFYESLICEHTFSKLSSNATTASTQTNEYEYENDRPGVLQAYETDDRWTNHTQYADLDKHEPFSFAMRRQNGSPL